MGLLIIIVGSLWAVLGLGNIVLSGAWKTSGTTMQSAVLIFNFAVFILPGLIVVGVGAILEIKPLLNKLLAELEETNQYLSELVEENDTNEESEEIDIEHDATEEESIPSSDGGKVHFSCDKCGTNFVATKEQIGKAGECPNCGAPIIVRV